MQLIADNDDTTMSTNVNIERVLLKYARRILRTNIFHPIILFAFQYENKIRSDNQCMKCRQKCLING